MSWVVKITNPKQSIETTSLNGHGSSGNWNFFCSFRNGIANFSIVNLVQIFRCFSTTTNPLCARRVNLFVYSLSLHRHSYIGFILAFASSIHNKQHAHGTLAFSIYNKQKNWTTAVDTSDPKISPSPRPRSSRSHALRYFGFLSVWPGLQFPDERPLGLDLIYVYPCNPVCVRRFKILLLQCLVSHYTDTHFHILSLALALLL